jgi:hypothetical protein
MALPSKLYADIDKNTEGFTFKTRNPAAEMQYTAQTLAEIMTEAGPWSAAETAVGKVLTSRYEASENKLWSGTNSSTVLGLKPRFDAMKSAISTEVSSGGTQDTALTQYYLGLSAAFGNGHSNTASFINLATQDRKIQIIDAAIKATQALSSVTYQATSAMPLVVPVESQLISDACASAIETDYLAQIRAQQVRQTKAAGSILTNIIPSSGTNPTPIDEVVMFGSIHAQAAAASQI